VNEPLSPVIDFDKYRSRSEEYAPPEPWMASVPVVLLIEYLRKYPDQGATLHARDEVVGLRFRPGINAAMLDNGRGRIAVNLCRLLHDAAPDLRAMIARGIEIPLLIRHQTRKAKVKSWTSK